MSELVTAFFLSELATYTVTDLTVPLIFGLFPIVLIICIEVIVSHYTLKIPIMKKIFDFSPSVLIQNGVVSKKELGDNRLSVEELLSQLRLSGFYEISKVRYAILEPNGQLSVVPFPDQEPPTVGQFGITEKNTGYTVVVINEGNVNRKALSVIGKDELWLKKELKKKGTRDPKNVLFAFANQLEVTGVLEKKE